MQLSDIQKQFINDIYDRSDDSLPYISAGKSGNAKTRLAIYQNMTHVTLRKTLQEFYPVIGKLVGEDFFAALAREYIKASPLLSGNMDMYGQSFSAFLENFPHVKQLPYLPDVAKLEWLWREAYLASDMDALDAATVQDKLTAVDAVKIVFHPSLKLIASQYPIGQIREVNQEGYDGDDIVDLDAGGVNLMLFRHQLKVRLWEIPDLIFSFLSAISDGVYVHEAIEAVGDQLDEDELQKIFATLIEYNLITEIK